MKIKISLSAALMVALAMVPGAVVIATTSMAQISAKEPKKQEEPKAKPYDDRQYKSAVERMPDQKFDPWRDMRDEPAKKKK